MYHFVRIVGMKFQIENQDLFAGFAENILTQQKKN